MDVALRRLALALLAAPAGLCACSAGTDAGAHPDAALADASVSTDADAGACAPELADGDVMDDAGALCADFRRLPCGVPPGAALRNCLPSFAACTDICGQGVLFGCQLTDASCDDGGLRADADTVVECVRCFNGGRRPRNLAPARRAPARSALGTYFADLAYLEAASVTAFEDLERALASFGAPERLRRAARRAARDERRHTRLAHRLAHRFGGVPATPRASSTSRVTFTFAELLADNVVEGCIGESYGALVALWQAERASDGEVARALRVIARDELAHAQLAWDVLAWAAPRTSVAEVRALAGAALAQVGAAIDHAVDASVVDVAGHPPRQVQRRLFRGFAALVEERIDPPCPD